MHGTGRLEQALPMGCVARQPLVDRAQRIVAYELLYRMDPVQFEVKGASSLETFRVMLRTLGEIGIDNIAAGHVMHVNVDARWMDMDPTGLLPSDRVVFELATGEVADSELLEQCRRLHLGGFGLAAGHWVLDEPARPLLEFVDTVKLDAQALDDEAMARAFRLARRAGKRVIAEKVEARGPFQRAHALGCDGFQGFFLARPEVMSGHPLPSSVSAVLDLLMRVRNGEDLRGLEGAISRDATLLYKLLKFAGSAAFSHQAPSSLRQALQRIGARNLERWLTLELYASQGTDNAAAEALFEWAASRAELMAVLAGALPGRTSCADEAAAVGGLSLLDCLLGVPMADVLAGLAIPRHMREALVSQDGPLGELLALVALLDQGDIDAATRKLDGMGIDRAALAALQVSSYREHARVMRAAEAWGG